MHVFAVAMLLFARARAFPSGRLPGSIHGQGSHGTLTALFSKKAIALIPRIGDIWEARMDVWRPTVDDVERISWGKPAKKKGTGSRGVPHRLNEEERALFDRAREKGFLEVTGSGWRAERRAAPLTNSYRSLCDARGQAAIMLHKGNTGVDTLVVDLSPLRNPETFEAISEACLERINGGVILLPSNTQAAVETEGKDLVSPEKDAVPWETEPIYRLPPYLVNWELPRSEAKQVGKKLAELFQTAEGKRSPSRKPVGIKPGKSRRHGGYGIG